MDKIAPSPAHPAAPAASPELAPADVAQSPALLRRPSPPLADEPVKTLAQRPVSVASSPLAEVSANPPAPAHDIDDDIRNHPLVDMDEVPMNNTQELARLGGMNLQDARGGDPELT